MKTKEYIVPQVLISFCDTEKLMKVSSPSESPTGMGVGSAPRRNTDVF
ncbi:MAG: hypothetical protein II605_06050 [Paludibacteraceae bacterium]|nr:hypothetical protein [Paludibacteraceae bacterium]MBQ2190503.1 hypothetical protein [Paludibacteraceae bacterium]MBQ4018789.1 hypothetical protein [Paludibacteraceae bacterium]